MRRNGIPVLGPDLVWFWPICLMDNFLESETGAEFGDRRRTVTLAYIAQNGDTEKDIYYRGYYLEINSFRINDQQF